MNGIFILQYIASHTAKEAFDAKGYIREFADKRRKMHLRAHQRDQTAAMNEK